MQKNLLYLSWPAAMFGNSSSQKVTFCSQVETSFTSSETATSPSCATDCFLSCSDVVQDAWISMPSETWKAKDYGTFVDFLTIFFFMFSKSKTDNNNNNNNNNNDITTKLICVTVNISTYTHTYIHTYTHTHAQWCTHTYMQAYMHACIHNFILFRIVEKHIVLIYINCVI